MLDRTRSVYELQQALNTAPPPDLGDIPAQLQLRRRLALQLATIAGLFTHITRATAPADAAAAAARLNTELVGLKALPGSSAESDAVKRAASTLVALYQQKKEREAARAITPFATAVTALFAREQPYYDSIVETYLTLALSTSRLLVARDAVEVGPALHPALGPFNLAPAPTTPALRDAMQTMLRARMQRSYDAGVAGSQAASTAMLQSLQEMDRRLAVVSSNQPLGLTTPPPALEEVRDWTETLRR